MKIEILGTGCPRCKAVEANARKAIQELGVDAEVKKIENIDEIISYGVMMTPAIAIDGKIKASGRIPNAEEIKKWIKGE